ncbi:MAG: DUF1540 domain-containing protein [Bacillota bacterium]
MSHIYCSIENCNYWDQGNVCSASEIMVTADSYAEAAPDRMDAPKHTDFPQMHAESCMETCCKTFVHKNSDSIKADGVTRKS